MNYVISFKVGAFEGIIKFNSSFIYLFEWSWDRALCLWCKDKMGLRWEVFGNSLIGNELGCTYRLEMENNWCESRMDWQVIGCKNEVVWNTRWIYNGMGLRWKICGSGKVHLRDSTKLTKLHLNSKNLFQWLFKSTNKLH